MKNILSICLLISILLTSCSFSRDCVDGINKMPLYGNGKVKKCPEQLVADRIFLSDEDEIGTRKVIAAHMVMRGWEFMYKHQLDTSIMRFNQAWLLDSLNAGIYWGLGDVLGMQNKFQESLPFFEKALKLDPNNSKAFQDASVSYGYLFDQTKDKKYLNSAIQALEKAVMLDPKNSKLYGQLTSFYCYFVQKDSARKYLAITDRLDPAAVAPGTRAMLINK